MPGDKPATLARFVRLLETWEVFPSTELVADFSRQWAALWPGVHQLAEWQDADLLLLLRRGMHHPSWFLRAETLELLGFHYDLADDAELLGIVRCVLLSDESGKVRQTAAAVLGTQTHVWDESLMHSLTNDPDDDVRRASFGALLHLLKLGFSTETHLMAEVEAGHLAPTLASLRARAIAAHYDT